MSNNNIKTHPKFLHGVRICGFFFTGFDFPAFLQSQEKRTMFHRSLQAENFFGQVIFKAEVYRIL